MGSFTALRMRIAAPSAHFRVPQTSNPRHTYPVPPYSTVIGLLANILGSQESIERMLAVPFGIGVLCRAGAVTQEYTWLRNLSSTSHRKRFGMFGNRVYQDLPEHPGGQQPVTFFVLNDVDVWIYLAHPDGEVSANLKENAFCSDRWLFHLHLGRSEDWAAVDEIGDAEIKLGSRPADYWNASAYRQWMPDPRKRGGAFVYRPESGEADDYEAVYGRVSGKANLITSVYRLRDDGGCRDFEYLPVRLFDGNIPWLAPGKYPRLFFDPENGIPVFFAKIDVWRLREEGNHGGSGQEQRLHSC